MATRLSSNILLNPNDITANFASIADAGQVTLGARAFDNAGNAYRFCKAGGTALAVGKLQQAPAQVANHTNMAVATAAIGATSVTVTLGATAATADQYAGGWLIIAAGAGIGYRYLISSHPAADSAATLVLKLEDPIRVATAVADSKGDLVANPFSGVIVNPTTLSSAPIGVAVTPVSAAYFGWVQTSGVASVLADGSLTIGLDVVASDNAAGAVEVIADGAAELLPKVGTVLVAASTGEYGAVDVKLG